MSKSDIADPTLAESADLLQQQIIYNGDILDLALDSLRTYRESSQSLAYLNASVHLSYVLMRLLERWTKGKGDGVYVRKKTARRRTKAKGVYHRLDCDGPYHKFKVLPRRKVFQIVRKKRRSRDTKIPSKKLSLPLTRLKWCASHLISG